MLLGCQIQRWSCVKENPVWPLSIVIGMAWGSTLLLLSDFCLSPTPLGSSSRARAADVQAERGHQAPEAHKLIINSFWAQGEPQPCGPRAFKEVARGSPNPSGHCRKASPGNSQTYTLSLLPEPSRGNSEAEEHACSSLGQSPDWCFLQWPCCPAQLSPILTAVSPDRYLPIPDTRHRGASAYNDHGEGSRAPPAAFSCTQEINTSTQSAQRYQGPNQD